MKSSEIRDQFLKYFEKNGHTIIMSSPLIPAGDASLLFTTAGMVQFKPMFAGEIELKYTRSVSSQKCLRTSDLENVGRTPRHHTFFEMLGNFSFGDYFKKEAIQFAWDFSTDVIHLDPKKIHVSVYLDDDESYDIWNKHIGIPRNRIVRLGKEHNFWGPAGETGACGPCSELYYDLGEQMLKDGDDPSVGGENDRYIEYWNLVFNQFNKQKNGKLLPLPMTGIDTGMGLERLALISQGVQSVYETDLFKPFIQKMIELSNIPYDSTNDLSYNVIADHIRAITFVLVENILPSNDGRGYVIRRILRRAIRFGKSIGIIKPFLYQLVRLVSEMMGDFYPEIKKGVEKIEKIVLSEEETFFTTLQEGSAYLENLILRNEEKGVKVISGFEAFKLYDSMGFPIDLTNEIIAEKGMSVDHKEYDRLMSEQKERGRLAWKGEGSLLPESIIKEKLKTEYVYEETASCESTILYLLKQNEANKGDSYVIESCSKGDHIILLTEKSPFYGESGGQVGDHGIIQNQKSQIQITNTQKSGDLLLHYGIVTEGTFKKNDHILLSVNETRKKSTARNHSATHLLQKALQNVIGDHVRQLGSLVNDEKLRFDFSHFNSLTKNEICLIEKEVNEMIRDNSVVQITEMDKEKALNQGALAFFGDKYDHKVRTVKIGKSLELCGGTHIQRSGDIGCFKIISESSISSGTRRIESVTGEKAISLYYDLFNLTKSLEILLNVQNTQLPERVSSLIEKNKTLEKEIDQIKMQVAVSDIETLIENNLTKIGEIHFISFSLSDKDISELRQISDKIKSKYKKLVTLLFSEKENKVFYLSTVSKDLSNTPFEANDLIKKVSELTNGKGGGKEQMAQGSASLPQNIPDLLSKMKAYVQSLSK